MVQGVTVAIMLAVSCYGCGRCVNEYIAPYKDLKTCYERVAEIKKKNPTETNRYCRLEGVVQELDYDK